MDWICFLHFVLETIFMPDQQKSIQLQDNIQMWMVL